MNNFDDRLTQLVVEHRALVEKPNSPVYPGNGIFIRYKNPVVTAAHTPLFWRYDLTLHRIPF